MHTYPYEKKKWTKVCFPAKRSLASNYRYNSLQDAKID